ncbi:hypothetical protein HOV93_09490 [Planctomycetes bacterium FF15]|uniref:Transposase Synechocystis PCC 6803 domain-containing protein n=1 Tax=Bremerella alba TaxID=980252 RepID=A0A7V9A602_9BACT|nr:hypothetical protein [Bremerella alba]
MKAYSIDLRERILMDVDAGVTTRLVALKYDVSESWVRRLKLRRRELGEVSPGSSRNRVQPKWLPLAEEIEKLVAEKSDITLRELRESLGIDISVQTLSRALRTLRLTLKKSNPCGRARSPSLVASGDAGNRSSAARIYR